MQNKMVPAMFDLLFTPNLAWIGCRRPVGGAKFS